MPGVGQNNGTGEEVKVCIRTLCLAWVVRGLLHCGVGLLAHLLDLGAALGVGGQGRGRDGVGEGEEGAVQGVEV